MKQKLLEQILLFTGIAGLAIAVVYFVIIRLLNIQQQAVKKKQTEKQSARWYELNMKILNGILALAGLCTIGYFITKDRTVIVPPTPAPSKFNTTVSGSPGATITNTDNSAKDSTSK